jgi:hypothetical protein
MPPMSDLPWYLLGGLGLLLVVNSVLLFVGIEAPIWYALSSGVAGVFLYQAAFALRRFQAEEGSRRGQG